MKHSQPSDILIQFRKKQLPPTHSSTLKCSPPDQYEILIESFECECILKPPPMFCVEHNPFRCISKHILDQVSQVILAGITLSKAQTTIRHQFSTVKIQILLSTIKINLCAQGLKPMWSSKRATSRNKDLKLHTRVIQLVHVSTSFIILPSMSQYQDRGVFF